MDNVKQRQTRVNLSLGLIGVAMWATSVYKDEIEPYRAQARELLTMTFSSSAAASASPAVSSEPRPLVQAALQGPAR